MGTLFYVSRKVIVFRGQVCAVAFKLSLLHYRKVYVQNLTFNNTRNHSYTYAVHFRVQTQSVYLKHLQSPSDEIRRSSSYCSFVTVVSGQDGPGGRFESGVLYIIGVSGRQNIWAAVPFVELKLRGSINSYTQHRGVYFQYSRHCTQRGSTTTVSTCPPSSQ